MADDWTDEQNDATVADYFAMLLEDIAGRSYNKAAHNRALQHTIGRPRGAIEWKHQNISAVLKGLGQGWLPGYKPRFNIQMSLIDAVVAIFVDGCFWHGCPRHGSIPKTNREFWATKLGRNQARDRLVNRTLRAKDWTVVRVPFPRRRPMHSRSTRQLPQLASGTSEFQAHR